MAYAELLLNQVCTETKWNSKVMKLELMAID